MRLFKSRKSGEYSDVSSVVANENDPSVKIVSCNSQQEFHNDANGIQNGSATVDNNNQLQQQSDANDNLPNGHLDEQKKHSHHHSIAYSLKSSDNTCTDKFTPIPDCDQFDEPTNHQYDETSSDNSSTATTTTESTTAATMPSASAAEATTTMASMQETKLHSDSTSDFINELFGTLLSIHISPSIHIVFHFVRAKRMQFNILFMKNLCLMACEKECVMNRKTKTSLINKHAHRKKNKTKKKTQTNQK